MSLAAEVTVLDDGTGQYTLLDDNALNLKGIIKLVHNDTLVTVYENAGYATSNFGAPDFVYDGSEQAFDVPAVLPDGMNGLFTFYVKRIDGLNVVTTETKESRRGEKLIGELEAEYNCQDGTLTVTDTTVYPTPTSNTSLSLLIVYPTGTVNNQTIATNAVNNVFTPAYMYTGVYTFTLTGTTEVVANTGGQIPTITIYSVTATTTLTVSCFTDFCKLVCLVKSVWVKWQNAILANSNAGYYKDLFIQAQAILGLALADTTYCGGDLTGYQTALHNLIGDCDCGCDEAEGSTGVLIKKCCD